MITKFYIEYWHPGMRKYIRPNGTGFSNIEFAEKIFNKSYNQRLTRRLVKETSEILYTEKAK